MENFLKILIISGLIIFTFFCNPFSVLVQATSSQSTINANVKVSGECDGNGICESNLGETVDNCPSDCGCNNNGICEEQRGEDFNACPNDCPQVIICNNNGICESGIGENSNNCPSDCGCNDNGICEAQRGENAQNCSSDCQIPIVIPSGGVSVPEYGIYIKNIYISKITISSAEINWQTTKTAICKFFWGKTSGYEKEIIGETNFNQNHLVALNGLDALTAYHFDIACIDPNGVKAESGDQHFATLMPLANVSNFEAVGGDKKVTLTWQNPIDQNFQGVKLLENDNFYPLNPTDGKIIYDGQNNFFINENLVNGKTYYYTIFAYDKDGNYSSGSIAFATPQSGVTPAPTLPAVVPPAEFKKLSLNDFDFFADGQKIIVNEIKGIRIENDKQLVVSINFKKVPSDVKTMIFTLKNGEKYSSFLFTAKRAGDFYEVVIPTPKEAGIYQTEINILDNKNKTLQNLENKLEVYKQQTCLAPALAASFPWFMVTNILLIILLIIFVTLLVILIKRRKKGTNENNK